MKVLVVEDELTLLQLLERRLRDLGCLVDVAENGVQAQIALEQAQYDVLVLDLGLPGVPGLEVLKQMRKSGLNTQTPVMILSARNSWQERVEGLKAGADDYLGKPFVFEELWARLEVLLRRSSSVPMLEDKLVVADLSLDISNKRLQIEQSVFDLTKTEYRLLHYFMSNPNQVLSKAQLVQRISDHNSEPDSNVIEVYIRKLRQKIGAHRIETLRGLGYRLTSQQARS